MAPKATATVLICMLFAGWFSSTSLSLGKEFGTCREKYLVAAKATVDGTSLFFAVVGGRNFTIDIPHYLPNECGPNYVWCGILLIEKDDQIIVFLPSQGGFVKVTYQNEDVDYRFHPVDPPCNPVRAFHNAQQNKILLECLNVETEPEGTLYIIELSVSGDQSQRNSDPFQLINTVTLSEAVYSRCSILFAEAGVFFDVSSCTDGNLEPDLSFRMENCSVVHHMDLKNGDAYVYCDVEQTWKVSARDGPENFQFGLYPCPDNNIHVRIEGGKLVYNMTTASVSLDFPYNNVTFGACVGREFWTRVESGQLLSISLTDNTQPVRLSVCSDSGTCVRPVIDNTRYFGAYFDPGTVSAQIVNFTGLCGEETVKLPFTEPDLLHVALGHKIERCMCSSNQPTGFDTPLIAVILVPIMVVIIVVSIIWWKSYCGKGNRVVRKPGNDHQQMCAGVCCCCPGPRTESRMTLNSNIVNRLDTADDAGSCDSLPVTCTPYEANQRDGEPTDVEIGTFNSHSRGNFSDNTVGDRVDRDRDEEDINRTHGRVMKSRK